MKPDVTIIGTSFGAQTKDRVQIHPVVWSELLGTARNWWSFEFGLVDVAPKGPAAMLEGGVLE